MEKVTSEKETKKKPKQEQLDREHREAAIDEAIEESFPASDSPAYTYQRKKTQARSHIEKNY